MPEKSPAPEQSPDDVGASVTPLTDRKTSVTDLGRLMTVAEVAAVMRVSRMTVYRLVHDDAIASVKVGRSYRVPERAVNQYLANAYNAVG